MTQVMRSTTAATSDVISSAQWANRQYLRLSADDALNSYENDNLAQETIPDMEFLWRVPGSLAGESAHANTVLLLGFDSTNSV